MLYKLLDWIDIHKLDWSELTENPDAIQLLEQYPEIIDWSWLSLNPNAIPLLERYPEKIDSWGFPFYEND